MKARVYSIVTIVWILATIIGIVGLYQAEIKLKKRPLPNFKYADTYAPDAAKPLAVVRLHVASNGKFFCSGAVISTDYVLTAAHCVSELGNTVIQVKTSENEDVGVTAVTAKFNERADYALITGDFSKFNILHVQTDLGTILHSFYSGDPILACGFPYGGSLVCSNVQNTSQEYFSVLADGFLYPGMSGGPVVDLLTGEVIGCNYGSVGSKIILNPLINLFDSLGIKVENK